jgi:PAS domain S-box-containing protein
MESTKEHYLKTELFEKLRNEPKLFEWIESGSVDGIWYWDLVDGEQEWLSPRFKSTFGFKDNEMEHNIHWWQKNIFPDDLAVALENYTKHAEDPNHPYDQIVRYKHRDGSTVWVRCRGLIIRDDAGNPIRMLGVHTDVTELKRAEIELENKTKALEKSNEELKRFAFVASHDLKSPINATNHVLDWIEQDFAEDLPEKAKQYLSLIRKRNDRMRALLDDLLSYSRVDGFDQEREEVNVSETVQDVFDTLNTGKNFTLSLDITTENIRVERVPFELVMRNLLSNAFKHHDSNDGEIVVKVADTGLFYDISVSDNGLGIPTKYHQRIFELFQTLKPKDKVEGSGLGLSLVSKTLVSVGGEISVQNLTPRGVAFNIRWPKP